ENEAIYLTGLLNSGALYSAITPFLPEGNFAKRHIHTWPARFIPKYDNTSQRHQDVVEQTRNLLDQIANDSDLQGMVTPSLIRERSKIRERISELPGATAYEAACEGIIGTGTTSSSDGPTEEEE